MNRSLLSSADNHLHVQMIVSSGEAATWHKGAFDGQRGSERLRRELPAYPAASCPHTVS